jgi:hypothetical protein
LIVTQPAHGKVVLTAGGGFTYTPAATFTGTDSFGYRLTSGGQGSEPATVTIVVR